MVRADHDARARARHRVLRDHPLPRLDVAVHEVLMRVVRELAAAGYERGEHGIGGRPDIDGQAFVRTNERERLLRVRLVVLRAVRQPHRDEPRLVLLRAQPFDGELREAPRNRRIDAAADAEYIRFQAAVTQIVGEESDAAFDFLLGVEILRDVHFLDDALLTRGEIVLGHRTSPL